MYCLSLFAMLRIEENINLRPYNSFGLKAFARCRLVFDNPEGLSDLLKSDKLSGLPRLITGRGTNLLFTDDFEGCLIHPEIGGIKVLGESANNITVSVTLYKTFREYMQFYSSI